MHANHGKIIESPEIIRMKAPSFSSIPLTALDPNNEYSFIKEMNKYTLVL